MTSAPDSDYDDVFLQELLGRRRPASTKPKETESTEEESWLEELLGVAFAWLRVGFFRSHPWLVGFVAGGLVDAEHLWFCPFGCCSPTALGSIPLSAGPCDSTAGQLS